MVEAGELFLGPAEPSHFNDPLDTAEIFINQMMKDAVPDAIRCLLYLGEEATPCHRRSKGTIGACIEQFLLPAQSYPNLVSANSQLAEIRNFAKIPLSNASLTTQKFFRHV